MMEDSSWMQFLFGIQDPLSFIFHIQQDPLYDPNVLGLIQSFQVSTSHLNEEEKKKKKKKMIILSPSTHSTPTPALKIGEHKMAHYQNFGELHRVDIDVMTGNLWATYRVHHKLGFDLDDRIVVQTPDWSMILFILQVPHRSLIRTSLSGTVTVLTPSGTITVTPSSLISRFGSHPAFDGQKVCTYSSSGSLLSSFSFHHLFQVFDFVVIQKSKQDVAILGFFHAYSLVFSSLEGNYLCEIALPETSFPRSVRDLSQPFYHHWSGLILFMNTIKSHAEQLQIVSGLDLLHNKMNDVYITKHVYYTSLQLCHNPKTKHVIVLNDTDIFKLQLGESKDDDLSTVLSITPHNLGSPNQYVSLLLHPFMDYLLAASRTQIVVVPYKV